MTTLLELPEYLPEDYFPEERSDAARNRKLIIQQARRMLKKMTIQELRMSDLAALAGIGKGTLYRRFENKAALAKALTIDDFLVLQDELISKNQEEKSPERTLICFVRELARFNIEHSELLSAIIMREDMPSDWWLESAVMVWLKDVFSVLYEAIHPDRDSRWFAANVIPVIMLLSPKASEAENQREIERVEWLVESLLKS